LSLKITNMCLNVCCAEFTTNNANNAHYLIVFFSPCLKCNIYNLKVRHPRCVFKSNVRYIYIWVNSLKVSVYFIFQQIVRNKSNKEQLQMVCSKPTVCTYEEFIRNLLSADMLVQSKRSPTFGIRSRNLNYILEFQNLFAFRKVSGHQSIKRMWVSYQHGKYATLFWKVTEIWDRWVWLEESQMCEMLRYQSCFTSSLHICTKVYRRRLLCTQNKIVTTSKYHVYCISIRKKENTEFPFRYILQ
jgi:hypothetical protein